MIFHILINYIVPCNNDYLTCAFNQLALRFSNMMFNRGHEVYFYGNSNIQIANCTQYYNIVPEEYYEEINKITSCNNGLYLTNDENNGIITNIQNKIVEIVKEKITSLLEINFQLKPVYDEHILCDFYAYLKDFIFNKNMRCIMPCHLGGHLLIKEIIFVLLVGKIKF